MSALPPPPGDPSLPPPPGPAWGAAAPVVAYAGFWQRFAARLIDGLILIIPFVPALVSVISEVDATIGLTAAQRDRTRGIWLGALALSAVYEISMIAWRGQTLGKMALGIKVVPADARRSVGLGWSAARWVIPALAGIVPLGSLLVYLWMLWDPMKQGLHDKVATTIVVRVRP
jgi:uncharacterized RDD family membrane protein YckC